MPTLFIAVLLLSLAGCLTPKTAVPLSDGYVRVQRAPDGCWEHVAPREYNVVLGAGLETTLQSLVTGPSLEQPQCWFERSTGTLVLVAGGDCGIHDEATFRRGASAWSLVSVNRQVLAMCHEKVR